MKTPNIIKKVSTLYKSERQCNPVKFETQRNEFLKIILNSKPRYNVRVVISEKPF